MARNGKVYLSAPTGDDPAVASLLRAFKAGRSDIWRGPEASGALSAEAQGQLAERDALIRVLNTRTGSSAGMRLELPAFLRLRAADAQSGDPIRRVIINLVTDAA